MYFSYVSREGSKILLIAAITSGKEQQSGSAQLMRHMQDPDAVLHGGAAPEPADHRPGGDQVFPVLQGQLSAEEHHPHHEIMLIGRKKGQFRCERGKHADAQLFHGMQGDFPLCAVFPREKESW